MFEVVDRLRNLEGRMGKRKEDKCVNKDQSSGIIYTLKYEISSKE